MSQSDPIISIRQVSKSFGSFEAIHGITMDIGQGEFFSLLGPSGCGKTTLLRMLAGFENASSGDIVIDGQSMADVPPYRRPVNMVFQSYAIFPHLNVRDNIAYGLRKTRLPKRELYARVDEMLELVRLPGYGKRRANQLSGGQRQRIALARALIMQPKVLLLDEPLGALDRQLREQMQIELRRLQRAVGITFVFVTHDQEEALTLSDRIAVMSGGNVLQVDSPSGLYESPRTRTVAGFIGAMNFLDARVLSTGGSTTHIDIAPLGVREVPTLNGAGHTDKGVCVAIRPENLRIHEHEPADGCPALPGTIESKAYLGERSHFHVRVPGATEALAVSAPNGVMGNGTQANEGRDVWLSWRDESLIVLDKD